MFEIVKGYSDESDDYGQTGQYNPINYQFAQRNKRVITLLAAPMRCRDFFNDAVAVYHGVTKFHYGFSTKRIKFNRYGLYVYYTNIKDPVQFVNNIEQGINPRLLEDTGSQVHCHIHDKSSVIMRFPTEVLKYTWRISLLTQLIRNSNWGISYTKWDDFFENWPEKEGATQPVARAVCHNIGFKPPMDSWWYAGPQYNPEKVNSSAYAGTIHSNGINTLVTYGRQHGFIRGY